MSSSWTILGSGFGLYLLTQLLKMLVVATFIPEVSEASGIVFDLIRVGIVAVDIAGMYAGLRWIKGDQRARIFGLGAGWACGDVLVSRLHNFWSGAWSPEFSWSHLCTALDSNVYLVVTIVTLALVDLFVSTAKRSNDNLNNSIKSQHIQLAVAIYAVLPYLTGMLSEWIGLVAKSIVVAGAAVFVKQMWQTSR